LNSLGEIEKALGLNGRTFRLFGVSEIEHERVGARGNMYRTSRTSHNLGRIANTKFTVAYYATRHEDDYSAKHQRRRFSKSKLCQDNYWTASRLGSVNIKENIHKVIYTTTQIAGNMDLATIEIRKFLFESYQGRRKSRLLTPSESETWRMCVVISRFYRIWEGLMDGPERVGRTSSYASYSWSIS